MLGPMLEWESERRVFGGKEIKRVKEFKMGHLSAKLRRQVILTI